MRLTWRRGLNGFERHKEFRVFDRLWRRGGHFNAWNYREEEGYNGSGSGIPRAHSSVHNNNSIIRFPFELLKRILGPLQLASCVPSCCSPKSSEQAIFLRCILALEAKFIAVGIITKHASHWQRNIAAILSKQVTRDFAAAKSLIPAYIIITC